MRGLTIKWQRLVDENGHTCERCGATEKEVEKALSTLQQALAPLGLEVTLEKGIIDVSTFIKDPLASNRIWIDNRPLEEWLGAQVGQSYCCSSPCLDEECRTITVEGQIYETIPADLIVKAGLIAASRIGGLGPAGSCCGCTSR
ncbi:MAG: DUF2703 domain-containing protein [bacterium]|nr:DUF2703 domain-containing protein [bacterium]